MVACECAGKTGAFENEEISPMKRFAIQRHAIASAVLASLSTVGLLGSAVAQTSAPEQRIVITGSSIKRLASEGALPVQTFSRAELERQGIVSAEQLIMSLNINGNGLDNMASNADVVSGQSRGNNGASSANLRGQGANATLILLNGRRVAAHGLNGGVVDLNQIPFAAVERVEVLKDGASSIYGTDAIGGVINFILRTNYKGGQFGLSGDITQHGGGNILKASLVGGLGDLDSDRYNVLAALSLVDTKRLTGYQRDFVNTFQPERGLSPDTRGTPYATLFAVGQTTTAGTVVTQVPSVMTRPGSTAATGPLLPGTTTAINGVNVLDLPGGAGCAAGGPNMGAYDQNIWAAGAGAQFGCAWDTGRAAVIQQAVKNTNLVLRGTARWGEHRFTGEFIKGKSESAKIFSENQITSGTGVANITLGNSTVVASPFRNLSSPNTVGSYTRTFDQLVAFFPALASNRGNRMAFRWRCMPCGPREIDTTTDTDRYLLAAEGALPFGTNWEYRVGTSQATSQSTSTLGSGYHYMQGFANLINNGTLDPFLLPGQSQSATALAALDAVSARGVTLYGGKFTMTQTDATVTGPLFALGGGDAMAAVGLDMRTEKYRFNGNKSEGFSSISTWVFNAPFDNINALDGVKRDVKAAFFEVSMPFLKQLEVTLSARRDQYDGFGGTTNPKASFRFAPGDVFMARGSYGTGFRVPTFNQLYNGITESPNTGAGVADPLRCPSRVVNATPGDPCNAITFSTLFGGKPELGPEKATLQSLGFVIQPVNQFSVSLDYWDIKRKGTIQSFDLNTILANYTLFPQNFFRDPATNNILIIDTRWVNAGETRTKGLEASLRANERFSGIRVDAGLDITYLLHKKSRLLASSPFGESEIGVFTRSGDLGIRWKHSAFVRGTVGDWGGQLTQVYRGGYAGYVPPGVANGSVTPTAWDPLVKSYQLWHATVSYGGVKNLTLNLGIKNLFDTDPPFANSYDTNTGSGSSWEPRVADPRGRSFLLGLEYKFF
jgi:iron complex outermembrane recepter protein